MYTCLVYGASALTVLAAALLSGTPLASYGPLNLCTALGMAVFCTLLDHSVFRWGLKYLLPAIISRLKPLEPMFASFWGLALFGERPRLWTLMGGAVIICGVARSTPASGRTDKEAAYHPGGRLNFRKAHPYPFVCSYSPAELGSSEYYGENSRFRE